MKRMAVLLWAIGICCVNSVLADVVSEATKLGPYVDKLEIGPAMKPQGQRLWGSVFALEDFKGVSFDNCDLTGVEFLQCNLQGASFDNAVLTNCVFYECEWGENSFDNAVINGFSQSGFSNDQLKNTLSYKKKDLSDTKIVILNRFAGAPAELDLTDFKLYKTEFSGVNLTNVSFKNASMHNTKLSYCTLDFAQFREAKPEGFFMDFKFEYCTFTKPVDLSNTDLSNTTISSKEIQVTSLKDAWIRGLESNWLTRQLFEESATFKTRDYSRIHFPRNGGFDGMDFSGTDLTGATFNGEIGKCKFDEAVITGIRFFDTEGLTLAQLKSTWNYRNGQMRTVSLPLQVPRHEPPRGMVFSGPELNGTNFSGLNLKHTKFVGEVGECNFTDAVLEKADLTETTGLTIEQIRSTRTYNRENGPLRSDMERIRLPESLRKELEADPAIRW